MVIILYVQNEVWQYMQANLCCFADRIIDIEDFVTTNEKGPY